MNKLDVAKFHKFLKQGISLQDCSDYLRVEVETLRLFLPEVFVALAKKSELLKAESLAGEPGVPGEFGESGQAVMADLKKGNISSVKPTPIKGS